MRRVPVIHCGTWLAHALYLPGLQRVFHVGGDLDFDNAYRWLAPWNELRSGRVVVLPAVRRFERGGWATIPHEPLRGQTTIPMTRERLEALLAPHARALAGVPLYISVDKDVLTSNDAIVNWDWTSDVCRGLHRVGSVYGGGAGAFGRHGSGRRLVAGARRGLVSPPAGLDRTRAEPIDPAHAVRCNEETNLGLITSCASVLIGGSSI